MALLAQAAALHRGELAVHLSSTHRDWLASDRYTLLTQAVGMHLAIAQHAADRQPERAIEQLRDVLTAASDDEVSVAAALRVCEQMRRPDIAREVYQHHAAALGTHGETVSQKIAQLAHQVMDLH